MRRRTSPAGGSTPTRRGDAASGRHHRRRLDRPGARTGDRCRAGRRAGGGVRHRRRPGRGDRPAARRSRLHALGGDARARTAGRAVGMHAAASPPRPVAAALAEGVHVYFEKPIARTLEDAEAIVAAAEAGPAVCAVGYQWHATELLDEHARRSRAADGHAARAELRPRRRAAVVHGPGPGRRADPRAGKPSHRPPAGDRRRDGGGRGDRRRSAWPSRGGGVDRRRDRPGVLTSRAARSARCTRSGRATASRRCTRPTPGGGGHAPPRARPRRLPDHRSRRRATVSASTAIRCCARSPGSSRWRNGDQTRMFCAPADAMRTLAVALACERALEQGRRVDV